MSNRPKLTFIGAGSTVFMKNIVGDVLQRPGLGARDPKQSKAWERRSLLRRGLASNGIRSAR